MGTEQSAPAWSVQCVSTVSIAAAFLLGFYDQSRQATAAQARARDSATTSAPAEALEPWSLAERIDAWLAAGWSESSVVPAPAADDAEFLRRVYLDISGRIPPSAEVRAFLADSDREKRTKLVERLLEQATFATHFGNTLRDAMLPGANSNVQGRSLLPPFERWLRLRLAESTPYDRLVAELLGVPPIAAQQVNPSAAREASPAAFLQLSELKAENLAASTSRIFLGIQLECAQCHNHPFAHWTREDFWRYAAFFDGMDAEVRDDFTANRRAIAIPGTDSTVEARFLDGAAPLWRDGETKRSTLIGWLVSRANPYFARAIANRIWAHFFGRGLVEPVDDFSDSNPPSHPAILDELARQLAGHDFDLKHLIRAITATRAYQLSSRSTDPSQDEPGQFARMPLKSMTAEQLFDCLVQATGFEEATRQRRDTLVLGENSTKIAFLNKFSDTGPSRTDYQASILQALTLMNGKLIATATSLVDSQTLGAVIEAPFLDTTQRIETLFLASLSRYPTPDELAEMRQYVERSATGAERARSLADVFWALLNSTEFALVH